MEETKKNGHVEGCRCIFCRSDKWFAGRNGKFSFLRLLIALAILALIFSAGVSVGRMKGYRNDRNNYGRGGYRMMMGHAMPLWGNRTIITVPETVPATTAYPTATTTI